MIRILAAAFFISCFGTNFSEQLNGDLRPLFYLPRKVDVKLHEAVLRNESDHNDIVSRIQDEAYVTKGCGYRKLKDILPAVRNSVRQTNFAELPWTVMIFHTDKVVPIFKCGGSLIDENIVLTAAHCVKGLNASELIIRAGEYDTRSNSEPLPHQDRKVANVSIHPDYVEEILYNDIALIFLSEPVKIVENVDTICLPGGDLEFDSQNCIASGWGKDEFGHTGRYQVVLKSVDLSIDPPKICQNILRTTRLGKHFTLHESFICASGTDGADTCTGDGGGPLICPLRSDPTRYAQVGVVAWGIGCGKLHIPGVYASVINSRKWINEIIMNYKLNTTSPKPEAPTTELPLQPSSTTPWSANASELTEDSSDLKLTIIDGQDTPIEIPQITTQAPQEFPDFADPKEKPEHVQNLSDQQPQQQQQPPQQQQQQQQQQQAPSKTQQVLGVIYPPPIQNFPGQPQGPRFILVPGPPMAPGPVPVPNYPPMTREQYFEQLKMLQQQGVVLVTPNFSVKK